MAFSSMEMKMRELQNENVELVTRWMALKAKDADRMNAENEEFVRLKQERERLELLRAATEGAPAVTLGPKPRYSFTAVPLVNVFVQQAVRTSPCQLSLSFGTFRLEYFFK